MPTDTIEQLTSMEQVTQHETELQVLHEPTEKLENLVKKWHKHRDQADEAAAKAYDTMRKIERVVAVTVHPLKPESNKNWIVYNPGGWECEDKANNPFFNCVYDERDDPMHDDCLFCHQPEERK